MIRDAAVVIPAYNEAPVIREVLEKVLARFEHVICVDDGSSDDTAAQIAQTTAQLVRHPINLGQGAALQTGIEFGLRNPNIRYFITYDADGQHRLEDAERMLAVIREEGQDIVLGSRFLEAGAQVPRAKRALLRMAVAFTKMTAGLELTDAHNGLRVFNRHVASTLQIRMPDMSHASEITTKIGRNNYTYKEVPVTIDYTAYSKQKGQPMLNAVNILFDVMVATPRAKK